MTPVLKNKLRALFAAALVVSMAVMSCKKDTSEQDTQDVQTQLELAAQILKTNNELARSIVLVNQATKEKGSGLTATDAEDRCGSLVVTPKEPLVFPKSVALDYGNGCTDLLGVARAGKILINLQKLWEPGSTSSIEYGDYTENQVKMNGKVSLSNISDNTGAALQLSVLNLKRTEATGAVSTVESGLTFRQTGGSLTFWDWADDVYSITGTTKIALSNGQSASMSITVPLTKTNTCAWVSKGSAALVVNNVPMAIDFGDGTCNDEATVTVNGTSYIIHL